MNLVFLCGALEPGRDGVGDYVRRLAGELLRQGHQVAAVALDDGHVTQVFEGGQAVDGQQLPVLRLPSRVPVKERFARAKNWVVAIDPEWLSLQFVPYSFSRKGLPIGLQRQLRALSAGRRWHIMFHELWVGMEATAPRKLIWWGWLQKLLIRALHAHLQPAMVHTQTRLYQAQLAKLGVHAEFLPLFANIPTLNSTTCLPLRSSACEQKESKPIIDFVFFGGIYPGAPIDEFAQEAAQYAQAQEVEMRLTLVGRCGTEQEHWATVWQAAGLQIELLGEQPPERISAVLAAASIGLSTTPIALAEKSGSIAAMRGHGLPVLCVSQPWKARGLPRLAPPPGVLEYRDGNFAACVAGSSSVVAADEVAGASHQLAATLSAVR